MCAQSQCYHKASRVEPRGCHVYPAGFSNFLGIDGTTSATTYLNDPRKKHLRCTTHTTRRTRNRTRKFGLSEAFHKWIDYLDKALLAGVVNRMSQSL